MSLSALPWSSYEIYDHRNAFDVLPSWAQKDIETFLSWFAFDKNDILSSGGGKTALAQRCERMFRNADWQERKVKLSTVHKIDAFKENVALEIEWNNKNTFYDRDLSSFSNLYAKNLIVAGVIITRSSTLQALFKRLVAEGLSRTKYGSTTTQMDQLITRLDNQGAGDCPVLAIGITETQYKDSLLPSWLSFEKYNHESCQSFFLSPT